MSPDTDALAPWGWTEALARALAALDRPAWVPARVTGQERGRWTLAPDTEAMLAGRIRHHAGEPLALPVVGDWVAVRPGHGSTLARIEHVLPRHALLVRREAGGGDAQALAANVDILFAVTSANLDFNLRRLERFLALAWEGGAEPVVVVNKLDLCQDRAGIEEAVTACGCPAVLVSAETGEGLEEVGAFLGPGRTAAFVGSSGVGKSSIINRLLGAEVQETGDIRETDDRGRHTTTRRELLRMPGGGCLIDTPGLREVGLWSAPSGTDQAFADIWEIAVGCRFNDCMHQSEPGCAVTAAVADGRLDPARLEAWHRLRRERAFEARKEDPELRSNTKARWKQIHKAMRDFTRGRN